jgi:hypothetical protein
MYRAQPSDLASDIRAAVAEISANDALVQQLEGSAKLTCQRRIADAFARLEELQARLPEVHSTFADLALLAELAYWWARKAPDGKLLALTSGANPNEHFAARLIEAVLTMAGPRQAHQACQH